MSSETVDTRKQAGTGTAPVVLPALKQKTPWGLYVGYLGIALIIIYCLLPFYWMIVTALRRPSDTFDITPVPAPPSLQNFIDTFQPKNNFTIALMNSVIVAGVVTIITLLIGTFAAYALARLNFRGKNLSLAVIIACSMFPGIAMVIPLFKLFTDIGWINTYQALILPALSFGLPLAVWNLTAFFRQMPAELEEAAMIDGCTQGQAFRKVIIPLAAPGVFTTAIIVFVAAWNEYIIALSMTNKAEYRTATVAVTFFTGVTGRDIPTGTIMAAGVILTVPLLIMVLVFQRRIVAGLTAGGVKS
ncbi:MAG: carbohydrate ABC transporter permease [Pseudonocardia sp.]|nr:carbohydrate ABC transporter permease [Pseudonocardia sp.]